MIRIGVVIAIMLAPAAATAQNLNVPDLPSREFVSVLRQQYDSVAAPWISRNGCCSRRNVLIGGLIGAGLGAALAWRVCDERSCTDAYIKYMLVAGGVGAGLGALIAPSRSGGIQLPGHAQLHFTSLASGVVRQAALAIRFDKLPSPNVKRLR